MDLIRLLVLTCAVVTVCSQEPVCPQWTVVWLLDLSENALRAATTASSNFDLIKDPVSDSLVKFARRGNVSVGAYGFSSSQVQVIFKFGTELRDAQDAVKNIGVGIMPAGSWTNTILANFTEKPPTTNNQQPTSNNIMVLVSSQGTGTDSDSREVIGHANRLRNLGWNIKVIVCKGSNEINMAELTAVNDGVMPVVIKDNSTSSSSNPKGYRDLGRVFNDIFSVMACPDVSNTTQTTTALPANTPTTQRPMPGGICSRCLYDAGFGFVADPDHCDGFIICFRDGSHIRQPCPSGTFFDGMNCKHINTVQCPNAVCNENTSALTYFPSARCCNKYFMCKGSKMVEQNCVVGNVFNPSSKSCEVTADKEAVCRQLGKLECDVIAKESINCPCAADTYGDPCHFWCSGHKFDVARGTIWNITGCGQISDPFFDYCQQPVGTEDRLLASTCTAPFLASFVKGTTDVFNEQTNKIINVSTVISEAILTPTSVQFTSNMRDPFVYYYYFSGNDIGLTFAIRLLFSLKDAEIGLTYDLLSNNYCIECPYTMSISITATTANNRSVSAIFQTTEGMRAVMAYIEMSNSDNWLDLVVRFEETQISGLVKEMTDGNTVPVQTAQFSTASKSSNASLLTSRCGIQLGRGSNHNLVGSLREFAVYRNCKDISSVGK